MKFMHEYVIPQKSYAKRKDTFGTNDVLFKAEINHGGGLDQVSTSKNDIVIKILSEIEQEHTVIAIQHIYPNT